MSQPSGANISRKKQILDIPGRICLFGDKVDLIGKPVIAATLNKFMHFKISQRDDKMVHLSSREYPGEDETFSIDDNGSIMKFDNHLRFWHACLKVLLDHGFKFDQGFTIQAWTDLPIGAGLSTSAASSVGFISALNVLFGLKLTGMQIAEYAYNAEHDVLGIMCGRMDQYSIANGGISFIETGDIPRVTRINVNKNLPLVLADSCEAREAKRVLNHTKLQIEQGNEQFLRALDTVHHTVIEARKHLENGCDLHALGNLMNAHQKQENIMSASTDKLNSLCKIALDNGALGAKQMGAGGGGCMLALCPDSLVQGEVVKAINSAGGKAEAITISNVVVNRGTVINHG